MQRYEALVNYDLSMRYFSTLDAADFERALERVLAAVPALKPVDNLPRLDGIGGMYVMVFDDIQQFYVGQASDIRARVRQHWTRSKSFDRLLFGSAYDSVFPVDELRARDMTRLFAVPSASGFELEWTAEAAADPRFSLNRVRGGEPTPTMLSLSLLSPRRRDLVPDAIEARIEARQIAIESVEQRVMTARDEARGDPTVFARLLQVDSAVHRHSSGSGATYWSEQSLVASHVADGSLPAPLFAEFLRSIGQNVITLPA